MLYVAAFVALAKIAEAFILIILPFGRVVIRKLK